MPNLAGAEAGVYTRCSADRNNAASVTEQEELGTARCEAEGWRQRSYQDNDVSASRYSRQDRPGWERLVADVRAGLINVVWLWESSRGDRKAYEWLGFLEDCRDRGVLIHVETHRTLYDPRVARHWKTLAEDGVNNAYASDETSLRVKRDLAAAAEKGRPHGPAEYGYTRRYDPATRAYITQEPDPDTAPVAAEIIIRAAHNEPLLVIGADLDRRGVRPPKAPFGPLPEHCRWSRQTIRQIAMNPAYAGYRRAPDGARAPDWIPVVKLDVHRAAVAALADQKRSTQRPGRQRHLLSYLARCGPCGDAPLSAYANRFGTLMYKCRAHGCVNVAAGWLDELVTLAACGALATPDAAAVFRSDSAEAARHRAIAARLRAQLDEWAEADISARAYQVKEAQLMPKIKAADRAAAAAEAPLVLRELLAAENVRAAWDALDIPARRTVIRALMDVSVARAPDQGRAARTDPARVIIEWKRA